MSWGLEHACILTLCGGKEAETRMMAKVKACLPSEREPTLDLGVAVGKLEELMSQPHFKMTPTGTQQQVKIALGIVKTLMADASPTTKQTLNTAAMTRMVLKQCAFFLSAKTDGMRLLVYGEKAYAIILEEAVQAHGKHALAEDIIR